MNKKSFQKVVLMTLDSVGVGALPDAKQFGDEGAHTLDHIARHYHELKLPNLESLGLGNIPGVENFLKISHPQGFYGKCEEKAPGKDTTSGHWEIAGVILEKDFATFPDGFPKALIDEFKNKTGIPEILGNYAASGTVIIEELGLEHLQTKAPIVYTSADSVFQIAAHEDVFSIEGLYHICKMARRICDHWNIGRVIARPFYGKPGEFTRSYKRRDFSMKLPVPSILDFLCQTGKSVVGIGKTPYIFADTGFTKSLSTRNNHEGMIVSQQELSSLKDGLIFTNLVDFDTLYGHRRDVKGYAQSLLEFDNDLGRFIKSMDENSILILTADHGCDPTFRGTDHTREYVPLLVYSKKKKKGTSLGIRQSFADIGKTILDIFHIENPLPGLSFLPQLLQS
ncbi:MAG: phosphopentomutase [Deltaproteobacteria bacterium]|nr:phosphopentomutase [Deltaproteobacteria bacterium]